MPRSIRNTVSPVHWQALFPRWRSTKPGPIRTKSHQSLLAPRDQQVGIRRLMFNLLRGCDRSIDHRIECLARVQANFLPSKVTFATRFQSSTDLLVQFVGASVTVDPCFQSWIGRQTNWLVQDRHVIQELRSRTLATSRRAGDAPEGPMHTAPGRRLRCRPIETSRACAYGSARPAAAGRLCAAFRWRANGCRAARGTWRSTGPPVLHRQRRRDIPGRSRVSFSQPTRNCCTKTIQP